VAHREIRMEMHAFLQVPASWSNPCILNRNDDPSGRREHYGDALPMVEWNRQRRWLGDCCLVRIVAILRSSRFYYGH